MIIETLTVIGNPERLPPSRSQQSGYFNIIIITIMLIIIIIVINRTKDVAHRNYWQRRYQNNSQATMLGVY